MDETTTEKRARCLCDHGKDVHVNERCLSSLTEYDHLPCGCPGFEEGNRLIVDIERLEKERDRWKVAAQNIANSRAAAERGWEQAEAQLKESLN